MRDLSCSVAESIDRTANMLGIVVLTEICNGNIRLSGDINAWIRVTSYGDGYLGNCVDVNSIVINGACCRRGVFTTLMRNLKLVQDVDSIVVSSVCTDAMYSWCVKNNCSLCGDYTFRYK